MRSPAGAASPLPSPEQDDRRPRPGKFHPYPSLPILPGGRPLPSSPVFYHNEDLIFKYLSKFIDLHQKTGPLLFQKPGSAPLPGVPATPGKYRSGEHGPPPAP